MFPLKEIRITASTTDPFAHAISKLEKKLLALSKIKSWDLWFLKWQHYQSSEPIKGDKFTIEWLRASVTIKVAFLSFEIAIELVWVEIMQNSKD